MRTLLSKLRRSEDGQDLIEYALLVGIITVGTVTLITQIGDRVVELFQDLIDDIGG